MKKIYLKYDDNNPIAECDYGFIKEMIFFGFIYPIMKKNYKMFTIMFLTELSVATLIMLFILPQTLALMLTIIFIFLINTLFAANYNMIVVEELLKRGYVPIDNESSEILIKKGIYFKLQ